MTVPEAIEIAKEHLATTLPEFSSSAVQLEELETPPSGSKWRFIFSGSFPPAGDSLLEVIRSRRVSKSVEIDSQTGELLAVKNAVA